MNFYIYHIHIQLVHMCKIINIPPPHHGIHIYSPNNTHSLYRHSLNSMLNIVLKADMQVLIFLFWFLLKRTKVNSLCYQNSDKAEIKKEILMEKNLLMLLNINFAWLYFTEVGKCFCNLPGRDQRLPFFLVVGAVRGATGDVKTPCKQGQRSQWRWWEGTKGIQIPRKQGHTDPSGVRLWSVTPLRCYVTTAVTSCKPRCTPRSDPPKGVRPGRFWGTIRAQDCPTWKPQAAKG